MDAATRCGGIINERNLHDAIKGGEALTVLSLDSTPSEALLAEIKADKDTFNVKVAGL